MQSKMLVRVIDATNDLVTKRIAELVAIKCQSR